MLNELVRTFHDRYPAETAQKWEQLLTACYEGNGLSRAAAIVVATKELLKSRMALLSGKSRVAVRLAIAVRAAEEERVRG